MNQKNPEIIVSPQVPVHSLSVHEMAATVLVLWLQYNSPSGTSPEWEASLKKLGVTVPKVYKNRRGFGISFTYQELHIETNGQVQRQLHVSLAYATRRRRPRKR